MKHFRESWPAWLIIIVGFILVCSFHIPYNHYIHNDATSCSVNTMFGFGTGNYIGSIKYPYILTAKHVIDTSPSPLVKITSKEDNFKEQLALLVIASKSKDFAILEPIYIPTYSNVAQYALKDNTFLGNTVYYYGLPGKQPFLFLQRGPVSYLGLYDGQNFYNAFSTNCHGGSSGATIFNDKGLGVGILCMSNLLGNRGTYGIYLPIEQIRDSIKESGISEIQGILDGKCQRYLSQFTKNVIMVP